MAGSGERLNSWKEIASYLGRDVRTAQRWEAEGLPVRRLRHEKLASVYALTDEIDAWVASRSSGPTASAPLTGPEPAGTVAPDGTSPRPTPEEGFPGWRIPVARTSLLALALALGVAFALLAARRAIPGDRPERPAHEVLTDVRTLLRHQQYEAAEVLLRRALDGRPDAPVPEALLAASIRVQGKPAADYLPWIERAVAHVARVERPSDEYLVRGISGHVRDNLWEAVRMYEAALQLGPSEELPLMFLADARASLGHDALAAALFSRWADLFPEDGEVSSLTAAALFQAGQFEEAARFRDRALRASNTNPYDRCWLRVMPAEAAWQRGDVKLAARLAGDVIRSLDVEAFERDETIRRAAEVLLLSGERTAAEQALQRIGDLGLRRDEERAWQSLDPRAGGPRLTLQDVPSVVFSQDAAYLAALQLSRGGIPPEVLAIARQRAYDSDTRALLDAEALRAAGDCTAAAVHYQRVLTSEVAVKEKDNPALIWHPRVDTGIPYRGGPVGPVLYAFVGQADCRARAGQSGEAIRLLERLISYKSRVLVAGLPGLLAYARGHELLAGIHLREGRPRDAARVLRSLEPVRSGGSQSIRAVFH